MNKELKFFSYLPVENSSSSYQERPCFSCNKPGVPYEHKIGHFTMEENRKVQTSTCEKKGFDFLCTIRQYGETKLQYEVTGNLCKSTHSQKTRTQPSWNNGDQINAFRKALMMIVFDPMSIEEKDGGHSDI